MQERKKLPIGIESFEEIRRENFYYVDKSGLIHDLLDGWGKVNLFTRPRRFGKSLNMNMLKYFFEYGCDSRLFDGLAIAGEKALCEVWLRKTISIRDADVRTSQRENFYHGILLGLLSRRGDWIIRSNVESGEGYSDILVEIEEKGIGIVVELKYVDGGSLDAGCDEALRQIEEKEYESRLLADGMETILAYWIACRRKRCRVKSAPCISSGM